MRCQPLNIPTRCVFFVNRCAQNSLLSRLSGGTVLEGLGHVSGTDPFLESQIGDGPSDAENPGVSAPGERESCGRSSQELRRLRIEPAMLPQSGPLKVRVLDTATVPLPLDLAGAGDASAHRVRRLRHHRSEQVPDGKAWDLHEQIHAVEERTGQAFPVPAEVVECAGASLQLVAEVAARTGVRRRD